MPLFAGNTIQGPKMISIIFDFNFIIMKTFSYRIFLLKNKQLEDLCFFVNMRQELFFKPCSLNH